MTSKAIVLLRMIGVVRKNVELTTRGSGFQPFSDYCWLRRSRVGKMFLISLVSIIFFGVGCEKPIVPVADIIPDNSLIRYHGRIDYTDPKAPILSWPGNSIEVMFEGTSVEVVFDCSKEFLWYNGIVDGDDLRPVIFECQQGEKTYSVTSGLDDGVHSLVLFRRMEGWWGTCTFKGLNLDPDCSLVTLDSPSGRKIEMFGDSITVGHACDKEVGATDSSTTEWSNNNYKSYGAVLARRLDADYTCIAKGGLSLTTDWSTAGPGTRMRLGDLYDRTNYWIDDGSWDFSVWQPDVVILNIFENDYGVYQSRPDLLPANPEIALKDEYKDFVSVLRSEYADAHIFCVLGCTGVVKDESGTLYRDAAHAAVDELVSGGDDKVYYHQFEYAVDAKGHPSAWHHEHLMADPLETLIRAKTGW